MAKLSLPTVAELRQLVRYEPDTGKIFWLPRPASYFEGVKRPPKYAAQAWNKKHAGKEAFTCIATDGYLYGKINQRTTSAHRVAVALMTGEWPEQYVDHINRDKLDNRASNLRPVTPTENARNFPIRKCNKFGVHGVDYSASREPYPWRARIVKTHLGWYETKAEAIAAREAAEKVLGYHTSVASSIEVIVPTPSCLELSNSSRPTPTS